MLCSVEFVRGMRGVVQCSVCERDEGCCAVLSLRLVGGCCTLI